MSWQSTRLKFVAREPITTGLGEAGQYADPTWPRYIRTTDIAGPRELRSDTFASLPPEVAAGAMVEPGDILMTSAGATVGKHVLLGDVGAACHAGFLSRFRSGPAVLPEFVSYWMESSEYWAQIDAGKIRSTIDNFSAGRYRNLRLSVPPLDEQRRIVEFLDAETAQLDDLLAEQHRLDQLARERWDGFLSSMVLGLDASDRKATGHPWWESLPSAWQVRELRFACGGVTVGVVVNPSTYVDEAGEVPFIRGTDVRPFVINIDGAQRMSSASTLLLSKSKLSTGDILVVRVGAPGTAAVVPAELDGANCASVLILRRNEATDPRFLCAVLNSRVGRDQVRCMSNGAAQEQVNAGDIVAMAVPFPDLPTQRLIGDLLDAERQRLLALQTELAHQVALLREHRQALITAAVTGGVDAVRKVA